MNTRKFIVKIIPVIMLTINMMLLCYNFVLAVSIEDYYPLQQSNSWTYVTINEKNETEENTIKTDGSELFNGIKVTKIEISPEENEYSYIGIDSQGIKEYKNTSNDSFYIYTPPLLLYPSIEAGESIKYSTNLMLNDKDIKEIEAGEITLNTIENMEVKAGKFNNCLKFNKSYSNKQADGNKCKTLDCTVWLAPGIGKIKEFCTITKDNNNFSIKLIELKSAIINGKEIKNIEH